MVFRVEKLLPHGLDDGGTVRDLNVLNGFTINVDGEEKILMEADPELEKSEMENEMIKSDITKSERDIELAKRSVLNPVTPPKMDIPEEEKELEEKSDEELEAELKADKEEIKNPILIRPENATEEHDMQKAPLIIINTKTVPVLEENNQQVEHTSNVNNVNVVG